jgi:hypothetical protein
MTIENLATPSLPPHHCHFVIASLSLPPRHCERSAAISECGDSSLIVNKLIKKLPTKDPKKAGENDD